MRSGTAGVQEERGKEGCAVLVPAWVWMAADEHEWCGLRIEWTAGTTGMVSNAKVRVYSSAGGGGEGKNGDEQTST